MLAPIVGFVGAVGCTVGAQTCPVVHGHTLVPFASATSCKVCCKKAFNAPKIAHFTKDPFFRDTLYYTTSSDRPALGSAKNKDEDR